MQTEEYSFRIEYDNIDMKSFIVRFHFDQQDSELLKAAGRFLAEIILVESGILYRKEEIVCGVTLGPRFDCLSQMVMEEDNLLLAYAMECLGMEFLARAYEKINEHVFARVGKWAGNYHFWGEAEMEAEADSMGELPVVWKNGMLHPLKSVIFTAGYVENREDSGCGQCSSCEHANCSFRRGGMLYSGSSKETYQTRLEQFKKSYKQEYSYGISRILKKG